ncbi:MAG TPA: uracil phosphoribosyltransferase [Flavobacteriales bacterium]|jgi:uracil phosphoribosyltransferase|nr:uracil phosphoribosyltransferase [Salibacteraceae bacterium]HAS36553.1 uracil phosphoribosyltransferase [Flavobacteriales bacterium]
MKQHILSENQSILHVFLNEIRSVEVQGDPLRFRANIERIGEIMAYELSRSLDYSPTSIQTPLAVKDSLQLDDQIVLGAILRASLPFHQGFLRMFDRAENTFLAAYRQSDSDGSVHTVLNYAASPNLDGKTLILCDPMLATGQSMVDCLNLLKEYGKPKHVHIVGVIGSVPGLQFVSENVPENTTIWLADLDDHLNEKFYIVPGLGDAGDLAYGEKLGGD